MSRKAALGAHAAALAARLGVPVAPSARLAQALTHPSAAAAEDNQRLEFLGDRVLGLTIAEALFARFPQAAEGDLAHRYNALVRKETCAEVAMDLGLGPMLRLGKSESLAGGRRRTAVLGDAMEAVIAAIHLDLGAEAARAAVLAAWGDRLARSEAAPRDAKTALQDWAQARGLSPPRYVETGRSGPDHAPEFLVAAHLGDHVGHGRGPGKRAAQQAAAADLLARLETPLERPE